jgi:hypothetical protein
VAVQRVCPALPGEAVRGRVVLASPALAVATVGSISMHDLLTAARGGRPRWFERLFGHQFTEWRHRRRTGAWCDHRDRVVKAGARQFTIDRFDGPDRDPGMTYWRMANLGINKWRFCQRCGRFEWV